ARADRGARQTQLCHTTTHMTQHDATARSRRESRRSSRPQPAGWQRGSRVRRRTAGPHQRLDETRMTMAGVSGAVGPDPKTATEFCGSRSPTIAAGTTDSVKNVLAEWVLGLPREQGVD